MMWRFITGLGIGGAIPNAIALLNEAAPKRYRASFVVVAFLGYATGTASAGQIAAWFTPDLWLAGGVRRGRLGRRVAGRVTAVPAAGVDPLPRGNAA